MKTILAVFTERSGVFSWRKAGTALTFLMFAYCCIGYVHTHEFNQLPTGYLSIIAMVFLFYFAKDAIRNISVQSKEKANENQLQP